MAPMQTRIAATFFILVFTLAGQASADVQLPGIISDHMLLQRDMPVRIFGKALPGESWRRAISAASEIGILTFGIAGLAAACANWRRWATGAE